MSEGELLKNSNKAFPNPYHIRLNIKVGSRLNENKETVDKSLMKKVDGYLRKEFSKINDIALVETGYDERLEIILKQVKNSDGSKDNILLSFIVLTPSIEYPPCNDKLCF